MTDKIKVTSLVESIQTKTRWEESYQIPVGVNPEKYCRLVIEEWNKEENKRKRYHPKTYWPDIRKFIKIVKVSKKIIRYCKMRKKNIHSKLASNNTIFDVMVCVNCGFKKRRYGLSESGLHRECHPEKTCKKCGIELKTEERFLEHINRIHFNDMQFIQEIEKHD